MNTGVSVLNSSWQNDTARWLRSRLKINSVIIDMLSTRIVTPVDWAFWNNLQWHFNKNTNSFIQEISSAKWHSKGGFRGTLAPLLLRHRCVVCSVRNILQDLLMSLWHVTCWVVSWEHSVSWWFWPRICYPATDIQNHYFYIKCYNIVDDVYHRQDT